MTQDEALLLINEAAEADPRLSAVGIRQGASFAFDPVVFLWFRTIESLENYLIDGMTSLYGAADEDEPLSVDRLAIRRALADRSGWSAALELVNETYWNYVQTQWIGTYEDLASREDCALGKELRARLRANATEFSTERPPLDTSPIKESEVEFFLDLLIQSGT